ncbi:MAG TPA: hypothetical protein VKJ47_19390 [Candidatus Binatia bacterium]|nr:hypothetical protein [Candidatus Binatia bacterium]
MRNAYDLLTCCFFVLGLVLPSWAQQGALETPGPGAFHSGVGYVRGWKCTAGVLTFTIDNGPAAPLSYGSSRADTQGVCGHSDTGFIAQENWNLAGGGRHTIRVFDNGQQFASADFTVTTLGGEFLTDLSGRCDLRGFPHPGKEVSLRWQESDQNFLIAAADDLQPVEFIANQVASNTNFKVTTVPGGKRLVITDVIISNSNSGAACCQRIFRNGNAATAFIQVGANSSFSHTFATGIDFKAGDGVFVQNGGNSGPTDFYLRGFLTNP